MTSVFVGHDFFGAGNFGDDLALAGFLTVAARHPNVRITICTPYDVESQRALFPQVRWLPGGEAEPERALRDADVWLGLGGTPFQLDSGPWLLDHNENERRRCASFGKPMYLLGIGCENPEAAADPRARSLLDSVERAWTRDERSAASLRPFIAPRQLSVGADMAHLAFGDAPAAPHDDGVVGLLLAFERAEQFDLHELETFLERRGVERTRWLVQETRTFPHVERWILAALAPESRARLGIMELRYGTASVQDYMRAFGTPETTVSSRYHGVVVAAWHGSKVLVVSRSAKLRGIADDLGLPQIDDLNSHASLETALATAAAVPRGRLHAMRDRARRMCDAFFELCA
ncbi:MAG TPA: polysaccharide pyruvyl transferase family protein [Dongiaceae bacterium]|nr:polysaccharide pyruvyl transferase family protein [Dongiaceae bacterium]